MAEKCAVCLYQPYYNSRGHFSDYFDRFAAFLQANTNSTLHGVLESGGEQGHPEDIHLHRFEPTFKTKKRNVLNNLDALFTLHRKVPPCRIYHFLDAELFFLFLYLAIFRSRYHESTIVITQHSTNSYKGSTGKRAYRFFIQQAYKLTRQNLKICFITNGRAIGEELQQFFGTPAMNIHLSEWGAEAEFRTGTEKKIPNSFLVAGILRKDKGLELLADVLPTIKIPINLTIAGYPMDYTPEEIRNMFSSLPNHITINFKLTYLSNSALNELMNSNEFLIVPYKPANKSSSGPLVQGLLYGIIPIVSNYGERARIVNEHASGISFDYTEQSLKEALHDALHLTDESKKKMRRQNKSLSNNFSWNAIFKGYTEAYEKWSGAGLSKKSS